MDTTSSIELTGEQRKALEQRGVIQGSSFVLMTFDAYRRLMGVGEDEELRASLEAIAEGLEDAAAGRVKPFRDVLADLPHLGLDW